MVTSSDKWTILSSYTRQITELWSCINRLADDSYSAAGGEAEDGSGWGMNFEPASLAMAAGYVALANSVGKIFNGLSSAVCRHRYRYRRKTRFRMMRMIHRHCSSQGTQLHFSSAGQLSRQLRGVEQPLTHFYLL